MLHRLSRMPSVERTLLKVVMIGESGVGKTCLMRQFVNRRFPSMHKNTVGADFLIKKLMVDDRPVTLQIWDTAGQERYKSLAALFYRGADCCIIVYDVTDPRTLHAVKQWREHFINNVAIDDVDKFPFLVIGNKIDRMDRSVTISEAQEYCNERNLLYCESSAKLLHNVDEAFVAIATQAVRQIPIVDEFSQQIKLSNSPPKTRKACC